MREILIKLCRHYPDAQKDIDNINGTIYDAYFSLAYVVTPALFVLWRIADDEFLTRVRLIDDGER